MKLSVNINKIATIRNARGGNNPNLIQVAIDCERFGADGITVHPRPDQRHIRFEDVRALKKVLSKEFNIEGNPSEKTFVDLVMETRPTQVTLVPDASNQLTSNHGWDTVQNRDFLKETVQLFSEAGMRVSIFVDPISEMIIGAKEVGAHRIELYTEAYARTFLSDPHNAREPYVQAAFKAAELGVEVNAGHDLDLHNVSFFAAGIPNLKEVSIGHALICDALYLGLENTIQMYKRCLQ
ncbi:MAG: pyridoxine 5'-phosphate synthase [Bacteroidetes bacterium]|nr:pyridoxine 5'-phosphate synthase [Bacteroidota bacterium]